MNEVVVVVLGYGCILTDRVKGYLDKVIDFVQNSNVSAIITTGGFTNPKEAPGVSEAKMMADYILFKGAVRAPIVLEEDAFTTNENLKNCALIYKQRFSGKPVVVFCDRARIIKVKVLFRLAFGFWPEVKYYEITKGLSEKLRQIIIATPLDILATIFPLLEKLERRRREKYIRKV